MHLLAHKNTNEIGRLKGSEAAQKMVRRESSLRKGRATVPVRCAATWAKLCPLVDHLSTDTERRLLELVSGVK